MVGRQYAGILGLIAFVTTLIRGTAQGAGLESTVLTGCGSMIGFAVFGYLAGAAGELIVAEGVRLRFLAELNDRDAANAHTA